MRKNLVAANWKMHGSKAGINRLLTAIKAELPSAGCEVLLCPPAVYLEQVQKELQGTQIVLGAQNAYPGDEGAFTGEVAFAMLPEFDCSHVIIGHSERREIFAESDEFIAQKFAAAQEHGLTPILCIGESQTERENAETEKVVLGQLQAVLDKVGIAAFADAVIAYEPIWAIGTGLTASPQQAQEVHAVIRDFLSGQDQNIAEGITILYGGSVKGANASELFQQPDIDGGLVGGASLKAEEFITICKSFN
tara:strand:+ start:45 stop:794 length:750 start_codon:yes stop_codon:yes gene_type:complete